MSATKRSAKNIRVSGLREYVIQQAALALSGPSAGVAG